MEIKYEGQPQRCEICHQSDQFDPVRNYCSRCNNRALTTTKNSSDINITAMVATQTQAPRQRCSICQHSTSFDPGRDYCSRCNNIEALRNSNRQIARLNEQLAERISAHQATRQVTRTIVDAVRFKDFPPRVVIPAGLFTHARYEKLECVVIRANEWIRNATVAVLNIETVIVPELVDPDTGETTNKSFFAWKGNHHKYQIIRVWYSEKQLFNG